MRRRRGQVQTRAGGGETTERSGSDESSAESGGIAERSGSGERRSGFMRGWGEVASRSRLI